jgi:hypothetical protein
MKLVKIAMFYQFVSITFLADKFKRFFLAGSRCRHLKRTENEENLQKVEEKTPIDAEHKQSATDSIRNFFQNIGTQMDHSDHVSK